jgi:hypothetical protein
MPLEYPLSQEDKGIIESADFQKIKSLKFFGGLPVFESVPDYTGIDGELVLYKSTGSSDYRLYAYIDSAWKKIGDIDFATAASWGTITGTLTDQTDLNTELNQKLENVVEDTTPQLGGDLDTNDKVVTSEGGKIGRYTITKTLTDETLTSLFTVTATAKNEMIIIIRYIVGCAAGASGTGTVGGEVSYVCAFDPGTDHSRNRIDAHQSAPTSGQTVTATFSDSLDDNFITVKVTANNENLDQEMTFTAIVEVIARNSSYTYAEA